jgi:hypothetical protein
MTEQQARELVELLKVAHPSKVPEAPSRRLLESRLQKLDYAIASAAVDELIDSSPFWPEVADFMAAYRVAEAAREVEARRARGAPAREYEDYCVRCDAKLRESLFVNGFCPDCAPAQPAGGMPDLAAIGRPMVPDVDVDHADDDIPF